MTSPFYRPTNPFATPAAPQAPSIFSGSKELSYAGLAAGVEGGEGGMSAQHVAQAAAMKASTEAVALAKSMSLAHGALGNAALLHPAVTHAAAAAASSEVSPLVQLIMKLPGALGITSSFFEWLQHLFAPGAHDLMSTLEGALHLDIAGHLAAVDHVSSLAQMGEHFTVSLNSLPTDAPILNGLKDAGLKASDKLLTGVPADHFLQNPANLGASADISHAQFEQALPQYDGALAGPGLSQHGGGMVLAGNQRLFSDNMSSGQFSSMVSNTSTPNTPNPALNTSGLSMPQPQAPYQPSDAGPVGQGPGNASLLTGKSDSGLLSGPNGSLLSGTANPDSLLSAQPGSLLTGKSDTLIASDVPTYNPSSGGHFQSAQAAGAPDVIPLKAKPLSFADLQKGSSMHGHMQSLPERGTVDHLGHQAKGHLGSAHATVDGIAHHSLGHHQYLAAKPSAEQLAAPSASHPVPNVAHEVHKALPARSMDSQLRLTHKGPVKFSRNLKEALRHQDQLKVTGMANKASQYSVQQGDSLWGIASNKLGEGMRWHEIYRLNGDVLGTNPNLIFSGTNLRLPELGGQLSKYIVKPGDNLWTIAKNQLGDGSRWGEIYKANASLIGESPRLILPGQQLNLPTANPAIAQSASPIGASPTSAGMPVSDASAASSNAGLASAGVPEAQAAAVGSDSIVSTTSGAASNFGAAGPGAAAAATIRQTGGNLVSSKLAPDLSFLGKKPD